MISKMKSRITLITLASILFLVSTLAFTCSPAQKKAAEDTSLEYACSLLQSGKSRISKDLSTFVCTYKDDRSEAGYQRAASAVKATLDNHTLSATEQETVMIVEEILKGFAPQTFAEMDPNSPDAKAAKKELEQKFKRLEKLVKE